MKKIAVFGNDLKFTQGIFDVIEKDYDFEVKYDLWQNHRTPTDTTDTLIDWADVLFCEWALGNVNYVQKRKKKHQKLIVRAHRFEMNTNHHKLYDYNTIDAIFTVSPFVYEEFCRKTTFKRDTLYLVYNAIDTHKFAQKKTADAYYNLAFVGMVPQLKRLDRALDIFESIYEKDQRYKLYIKGHKPEDYGWVWNNKEQQQFYQKCYDRIATQPFGEHVIFEGWGDVSEFYTKIGFVLSISDYESFHLAPLEGAASRAIPLVLNTRSGIRPLFLEETIFDSIEEITEFVVDQKYDTNLLKKIQQHVQKYDVHIIAKEFVNYFD